MHYNELPSPYAVSMLIEFTFSNYRSFYDEASFSMVAGRVRSFKESLFRVPCQKSMKLLPLTAMFGANAAGKSTFVKALEAMRNMVVTGQILAEPFCLKKGAHEEPTEFSAIFVAGDKVWNYGFSIKGKSVVEEFLQEIVGKREHIIFERSGEKFSFRPTDKDAAKDEKREFIEQFGKAVRSNTLFLSYARMLNSEELTASIDVVYNWFFRTLNIITPDSACIILGAELWKHKDEYSAVLNNLGTGIKEICQEEVGLDQLNAVMGEQLQEFKRSDKDIMIVTADTPYVIIKEEGDIRGYRWSAAHRDDTGKQVLLTFNHESDGTRRLLHLLPTVIGELEGDHVFVIDELDRSLHTELTRHLVSLQRQAAEQGKRQQMIFTTHDLMLMKQDIMRRDEMWAVEKKPDQSSILISFEQYVEIRKDKDIQKSYLEGRMGGVPQLTFIN